MAEVFEHFAEEEPEAIGGILRARPLGGVEQLVRRGFQIEEVLQSRPPSRSTAAWSFRKTWSRRPMKLMESRGP